MASNKARVDIPALQLLLTKLQSVSFQPWYHHCWGIPQIMMLVAIFQLPFFKGDLILSGLGTYGTQFDYTDLLLLPLVLYVGINGRQRDRFLKMPCLYLWIVYGTILSMAYINSAMDKGWLVGLLSITYQLYRYAWKSLLFCPLVFVLFQDKDHFKVALFVLIVMADISAVISISQGYRGFSSVLGPFGHKNALGGFLVLPISLVLAIGLNVQSLKERIFYGLSFLVLLRALLFTQSRGALAGWFVSLMCLGITMGFTSKTRKKLSLLILGILGGIVTLLLLIVIFNKGVSLHSYKDLSKPTEAHTLKWRMEYRWPHFYNKVFANPWLGIGTDVDWSLGPDTNTPHNGYLSRAMISGIPSLFVFLSFIIIALKKSLSLLKRSQDMFFKVLAMGIISGLGGLCTHSMVDAVFMGVTEKTLWITFGLLFIAEIKIKTRNDLYKLLMAQSLKLYYTQFAKKSLAQ